ncbi:unnamed protein product [Brassica oleracea var. botrytis]|uniref:(rape) hypothetical protein n=1 Tax=Brassica napus TaxID=3708 RepID=A0A816J7J1_BRANA|nr:unnamed protein product [Brassica napus]
MDLLRKELHGGLMNCTRSPVIRRRRRRGANHVSRGIFNYLIFSGTGARLSGTAPFDKERLTLVNTSST